MRGILLDWLVQIHARFRLLPETFLLCVNIIDRFLSSRVVLLAKLQLVGITCLFLSMVEEIVTPFRIPLPSLHRFLDPACRALRTEDDRLELDIPKIHFLRRISKADDYDVKARTIGKHLLEVGTLEWRLLATPPSLMAVASIWLARLILGNYEWVGTSPHAHRMFFDSFHEDCKPRPLPFTPRARYSLPRT
jgi:hypothetical protein